MARSARFPSAQPMWADVDDPHGELRIVGPTAESLGGIGNGQLEPVHSSVTVYPSLDTDDAAARAQSQDASPTGDGDPLPTVVLRFLENSLFSLLGVRVEPNDRLTEVGIDSLAYAELRVELNERFDVSLGWTDICDAQTAHDLARMIVAKMTDGSDRPIGPAGDTGPTMSRPLFVLHPSALTHLTYSDLTDPIDPAWAVTGIGCLPEYISGSDRASRYAAVYAGLIREVQPAGPYALGGYGSAQDAAVETARLLSASGEVVDTILRLGHRRERSARDLEVD